MGIVSQVTNSLYKDTLGQIPTGSDGQPIPALLFANSKSDEKFGDLYLFNNFGISGGDTITLPSEITTHYVEDNSAIQDHWALSPITYNLTGYIGEVIYQPATQMTEWVQSNVTDYLAPLSIISPTVSSYVGTAMGLVHQMEANFQRYSKYAENIIKKFNSLGSVGVVTPSKQEQVYRALEQIRNNRILVNIYTPYTYLTNMAIVNISMSQTEKTKYQSNIQIQLQEYREVKTITRKATEQEVSKLVASQQEAEVNTGQAKGENISKDDALLIMAKNGTLGNWIQKAVQ